MKVRTSTGTVTLIDPTGTITTTGQELVVDGVRMVFQMAPGTEAPAEMHFYFPAAGRCAWPRTPPTTCTTC
jgi:alkyl sulfatase BDS1-like metallo-beta-lactamase superfamily hydrolase